MPTHDRQPELAARMRRWNADLTDLLAQVRAGGTDVELFHGLRVLIRRLRSAMRFLDEAGARRVRGARALDRTLRAIAQAAGPVRDADVLDEHVRALREDADPRVAGWLEALDLLAEELVERRESGRRALVDVATETKGLAQLSRAGDVVAQVALGAPATPVLGAALSARIDELAQLVQSAQAHGGDPEEWHRVRIAIKRVRYVIELMAGRDAPVLEGLVHTQGTLGKAHDHRLWQDHARTLRKRLTRRGPDVLVRAGLAAIAESEAAAAAKLEQRFAGEWEALSGADFQARLMRELGIETPVVAGDTCPPDGGSCTGDGAPREGDRA